MSASQETSRVWFLLCFFCVTYSTGRHVSKKEAFNHSQDANKTLNHTNISGLNNSTNTTTHHSSADTSSGSGRSNSINASHRSSRSGFSSSSIIESRSIGYRNGGFPKFPTNEAYYGGSSEFGYSRPDNRECGQRRVFHDMERKSLKPTGRVIGGSPAPYGAYPWTANIKLKYGRKTHHHCGGTIISRQHILTAAHCVDGYKPSEFTVTVGDNSRLIHDEDEQTFQIETFRVHPDFKVGGQYMNDVAVLKLSSDSLEDGGIALGLTVSAACLPTRLTPYTHGTWCYVSGWGLTNIDDHENKPDRLRAASVPLLASEVCEAEGIHGRERFGPGMVCAGYLQGTVDACGGDSGGPLVCEVNGSFKVLGIVSWGSSCARPNKPGVYTKVQYYIDWINQAVDEM